MVKAILDPELYVVGAHEIEPRTCRIQPPVVQKTITRIAIDGITRICIHFRIDTYRYDGQIPERYLPDLDVQG